MERKSKETGSHSSPCSKQSEDRGGNVMAALPPPCHKAGRPMEETIRN